MKLEGWMVVGLNDLDYGVKDVIFNSWHSIVQLKKQAQTLSLTSKNMFHMIMISYTCFIL
jgi:hypothetical protein